jgi:hypothetical protein
VGTALDSARPCWFELSEGAGATRLAERGKVKEAETAISGLRTWTAEVSVSQAGKTNGEEGFK